MDRTLLEKLTELDSKATAGPWFVRHLDDDRCMGAVGISTEPDTGENEEMRWGDWPGPELLAATLIQSPPYVIPSDQRWQENADLIVAVRNALAELLRLAALGQSIDLSGKQP